VCEANAYLRKGEVEELVLSGVDRVEPRPDGLLMENIFGQRKLLKARIKEMALVDHRIILEELNECGYLHPVEAERERDSAQRIGAGK
jgi:predicted RNA-binding protein